MTNLQIQNKITELVNVKQDTRLACQMKLQGCLFVIIQHMVV